MKLGLFAISLLVTTICFAQLPAGQNNKVGLKQEIYGGLNLHSSGFGATITYSKFLTFKKKRLFSLDMVSLKHSKEIKIKSFIEQSAKDFVYGKLNGVLLVRPGFGQKTMAFEKLRDKGVQISWHWTFGPSLSFMKPYYLDIQKYNPDGSTAPPAQEAFNPEDHNLGNIQGKSRGIIGLAETSVVPGGFIKLGLEFEYNYDRELIRAIEAGIALDVFPRNLDIMAYAQNTFIYPSAYLNLLIGKRFI